MESAGADRTCRLCTRDLSDAASIHLYSADSVERGVADRMANVLEVPVEREDGLSAHVCELCNARFNQLVRKLEVHRLDAKKNYEKQAKKAGVYVETLEDMIRDDPPTVEDAKNPTKDPLVQAADMTSMDLGSLLSDLVAAKKRMREKKATDTDRKIVTEDIKDLMNLLSGIRKEDVFVFGTFLGVPESQLKDIELNHADNHQRFLTEVVMAWINACPHSSTWSTLVEALTEVGRRKTAQEVAEKRGIVLPGVFDDGQLWGALKALIPINEGGDLVTLLDETEKLRKDVKTKDALLLETEDRLEEVNSQKDQFEQQYNDTLQELNEQKNLLEEEKSKAQKTLREKEAELRKLRAERASKEEIETKEIEIMYLKKRVQQHQAQEKELVAKIGELQAKLDTMDIGKLDWIASNLEKQLEGVRPEFERDRSQMMTNIYKMLKYIKIPQDLPEGSDDEEEGDSPDSASLPSENVEKEELRGESGDDSAEASEPQQTPEPEPSDLESLLSTLKSPTEADSAISMFEDKVFVEADYPLAERLFQDTPPFLLSQLLGLRMDQWLAVEAEEKTDQEKQRGGVLRTWGRTGDSAKWSVLLEALIIVGLRGRAQIAYMERGVPLPDVSEDGTLWSSVKETLLTGNEAVQQMFLGMEEVWAEVKGKDEEMCTRETQLEQVRTEGELLSASLRRAKQDMAREILQVKALEVKMGQVSPTSSNGEDAPEAELGGLKSQHREHMEAVQSLWREQEAKKTEYESHVARLEPQVQQMNQMKAEFAGQRNWLVARLEETYELFTGREKPVPESEVVEVVQELMGESAEEDPGSADDAEETEQQATPEPEPTDLESLLSSLKSPAEAASAISMFEDKVFVEKDYPLAERLFQDTPPFLLSQLLCLRMDQWLAVEAEEKTDQEKQRGGVLRTWGRTGDSAKWSVLVEALIIVGLRGRAQIACIEKGVPLPNLSEDGPLWSSVRSTLLNGNEAVQRMFLEMEGVQTEVKGKDEEMCTREIQLEQVRSEGELLSASLRRAKQDLAREMSLCKVLEVKMGQVSLEVSDELFSDGSPEREAELGGLKSQHREHMEAVQSLWREQEAKKTEYESHVARLEPQVQQMNQMKAEFAGQRNWLVARLEETYELFTGREKPVPKVTPVRPPPFRPKPTPPPPPPVPPSPLTPGGYRTTSDQLIPTNDPVLPTGYTIMDLFHPSNTFSLLPGIDSVGRPLAISGNMFTGISLKGRGSLTQECGLMSEVVAPFVVTLRVPNRGRLMVDDRRAVSIKNTPYQVGDLAFEFIIRPYKDTKVTFESRKFVKSFLSVDQSAHVSVQEMPPDSSEVQFVVRVQRFVGPYTTPIACPHGRPSIVNQMKDRSVIQLYSKLTSVYLGLRVNGDVVGMTNPDNDKTFLVFCDRGLGRVSLQSYTPPLLKVKMRFNGALICQGEENLDNDFYLKEAPDGTVLLESVPNKGRYIQVTIKDKRSVNIIRNFSITLLVFGQERGRNTTVTKYALN